MTMQQVESGAGAAEIINENFEIVPHVYGKRHAVTTALIWGYYGGISFGGNLIADGQVTLTNNAVNYIVANRSSGAVSVATGTTNWNDTTNYARIYKVTTSGGQVSSGEDHRFNTGGLFNPVLASADTELAAIAALVSAANKLIRFTGSGTADLLDFSTSVALGTSDTTIPSQKAIKTYVDTLFAAITGGSIDTTHCIPIACSDETTALTTGANKVIFHAPYNFLIDEVFIGLSTPQSSGSLLTVDINTNGISILSTKITVDNGDETSLSATTPPVFDTSGSPLPRYLSKGEKVSIDIDQVGNGTATGLKVYLIGRKQ